jgi:hypothetical protein
VTRFCHFHGGGGSLFEKKLGSQERVAKFLMNTAPEEFTPKEISVRCNVKKSSITKIVSRLLKNGKIEKSFRGLYRGKITVEKMLAIERTEIKLHGVKIEFFPVIVKRDEKGQIVTERGEGLSLCHLFSDLDLSYQDNTQMVYHVEILSRSVTIQLMRDHVGIFCKCSSNPFSYLEFKSFRSWLEGKFGNAFILGKPVLVQVGLNKDYKELRLDGVSSIKLQLWENAWQQIYQKGEDVLRREVHLSLKPKLGLDEAIDLLSDQAKRIGKPPLLTDFHPMMYQ